MATVPTSAAQSARAPWTLARRLTPAEGWSVLLLHVVVALAAAWTVALTPLAPPRADLAALTLGGLAVGFTLGKLRAPDLLAHLVSFAGGILFSAWLVVIDPSVAPGGQLARARALGDQALEWYRRMLSGREIDDPALFAIILGLTVWLVAYTSAWTLYRRGWLATALLLPATIAFVNLGYAGQTDTTALLILLAAGCALAARYHGFRRERVWARSGLSHPTALPRRFLWAGLSVALAVAVLGWALPLSARDGLGAVWQRLEEPWSAVQDRWDDALARIAGNTDFGGGSYATFGDKFRLGGPLNLTDDPVMIYRPTGGAAGPTYLAGHRYDGYDGQGWSTRVGDTFEEVNANGDRYSAQMTFARGQGVHLSTQVLDDRVEARGTVEVLRPKGDLLFTRDTYLTSDRQTNVQLSWRQLDNVAYDLAGGDLSTVPLDLRLFAQTLRQAAFDPAAAGEPSPLPVDAATAAEIQRQSDELRRRFLDTSWTVGPDGRVQTLTVNGQAPVYDDVEAIYSAQPLQENDVYAVAGLLSAAPADALRAAGQEYPDWVTERYLQLPDTITPRTRDLAAQLAAGQPTVFDTAMAVQDYVRSTIRYEEQIQSPPPDRDVVDYVLFDSKEGYCTYYASAMAVLLRIEGIPTRVVAGYYAVPWDDAKQGYLYREKNAHLWVEVFFPGYGWIPFEPTASQEPLEYGDPGANPPPTPTPTPPSPTPEPQAAATPPPAAAAPPAPPSFPPSLDGAGSALGWLGVAAGGLLLLAIVAAVVVWQWKLRGLSPAEGLYARALRVGRLWGVRASPAQTPIEYAEQLGQAAPATRRSARVVADLYSQEIYAGRSPAPGALAAARAAWADLRRAMLGAIVRRKR